MSAQGEQRTFKKKKENQVILKYYNTAKCRNDYNYDYELRWTTNHHNSAVLRLERAPASMCPSPNRPRYQTCVWMDPLCTNVWTQRWGARFISSNETPPHAGRSPLPLVGGARSPAARVRMLRESGRMSRVCLAACVNWECARLGENACRDEEKWKNNQQQQKKIQKHLKRKENCNNEVRKGFRKKFCLWEADLRNPWKKELWIWENHCRHQDFVFDLLS